MSSISFPEDIASLDISKLAKAMLTILRKEHKGERNAVKASELAYKMQRMFPNIAGSYSVSGLKGSVSKIGRMLVKYELIKSKLSSSNPSDPESFNVYWYWVE